MSDYIAKILKIEDVTHDVKRFVVKKPKSYKFIPGQATEVSINKKGWKEKKRPFTFTSLNEDNNLEFTIKIYLHNGVTEEIGKLKRGEEFIISKPFGTIQYKGKGVFIAGGAGITPFIAILRQLHKENKLLGNTLIFSNKTEKDIILKNEFDSLKELKKIYTLTRESNPKYENNRIDERFLKKHISDFNQFFYICGPIRMVGELQHFLTKFGANLDFIVVES